MTGDLTGQVKRLSLQGSGIFVSVSRAWVPATPGCLRWDLGSQGDHVRQQQRVPHRRGERR